MRNLFAVLAALLLCADHAAAQALAQVTFEEAVRRATTSHPTVRQAAAGVLRAQAVFQQARARTRPALDASFSTNVIEPVTSFGGEHRAANSDRHDDGVYRAAVYTRSPGRSVIRRPIR